MSEIELPEGASSLYLPGVDGGLDLDGLRAAHAAFDRLCERLPRPVVVLQGRDDCFCRGMSLPSLLTRSRSAIERGLELYAELLWKIRAAPVITVAAVDGPAVGGGVGIAAAADLVLATGRSRFSLPEVALGLTPAMVMPVLSTRMSTARSRLLALRASSISAAQALEWGLVDEVVEDTSALQTRLRRWVRDFSRGEGEAIAAIKHDCAHLAPQVSREGLQRRATVTGARLCSPVTLGRIAHFMGTEPEVQR